MIADEMRNRLIVDDITEAIAAGRYPLILTERKEHLRTLEKLLDWKTDFLFVLYGGMREKTRQAIFQQIKVSPENSRKAILATGSYIGEGFDEPALDTLFLTMPSSFKGKIVQYAGRLHRAHTGKQSIRIYDYADTTVSVLETMKKKRLKTYKMLGYEIAEPVQADVAELNLFAEDTVRAL
ncbi:MAG: helicase-related protein [Candidatus Paceibacterota bacterium]